MPTITLAALAHDPLGAVASYWHTLVTDHADAVPALLGVVRDVLAADGTITGAILGDGTAASPWRIRLAPGFELQVQVDGSELQVTAMGTTSVDTLGARCTVVEGNAGIELATIDLAGGHAAVMTGLVGTLTMRGRGLDPPRAVLDLGAARLEADHVGVAIRWTPAGGLRFATSAPNLAAVVGETSVPLALPTGDALDDAGLAAAETLIGLLAPLAPSWLESVVGLLGWGARVGTRRLSLVSLLGSGADPAAAVAGWLAPALGQVGPDALSLLADLLAGDGALAGVVEGEGTPEHPFEVALSSDGTGPTLAIWFPPAGPSALLTAAGDELVRWRPGAPGLATDVLVQALEAEALVASDVADLVWNRDLSGGLEGLVARWSGGDGRIVPPLNPPAGVDVVTLEDLAAGQVDDALDLADLLDHDPPVTFHVRIAASADGVFPDAPAERVVDLTPANRAPETFTAPAPDSGDWFVVLGTRAACRLATGDPDGTLGQAARLARLVDASSGLGPGQLLVGHGGAGHAARLVAADGGGRLRRRHRRHPVRPGVAHGARRGRRGRRLAAPPGPAGRRRWRRRRRPGPRPGAGRRAGRGRRQRRPGRGAPPARGRHPRPQRPEGARGLRRGHRAGGAGRDHRRRGLGPGRPGDAAGGRRRAAPADGHPRGPPDADLVGADRPDRGRRRPDGGPRRPRRRRPRGHGGHRSGGAGPAARRARGRAGWPAAPIRSAARPGRASTVCAR